jgi:glyoxylase-like metal-dependent hydrolase (beta-lactamase superfamily II)
MHPQKLGALVIETVDELGYWPVDHQWLLPSSTLNAILAELSWMGPIFVEPGTHKLVMGLHAYLIRTPRHTILVDTCCGNDKERDGLYPFHRRSTAFLERLATAGVHPADVDFVMCTHLHADHIGWNTRLENGRWIPTFPNARYIFSRKEADYWAASVAAETEIPMAIQAYNDSVLPVIEARQALLVEHDGEAEILGREFRFFPLNGHTPGHTGLMVTSGDRRALLTGDAIHHPVQFVHPDWGSIGEVDATTALVTRRRIIDTCLDQDVLLLTGHFPAPTAGHVISQGGSARFCFS